jgi:cytochrome P450
VEAAILNDCSGQRSRIGLAIEQAYSGKEQKLQANLGHLPMESIKICKIDEEDAFEAPRRSKRLSLHARFSSLRLWHIIQSLNPFDAPLPPRYAPSAPGNILLQSHRMRLRPLQTIDDAFAVHHQPDAIRLHLGPYDATLFRHPDHVRRVLTDNHANYSKNTRGYRKSKIVLGEGLVTSEGELWTRQRRIATPAFHRQRVAQLAVPIVESTLEYCPPTQTDVFADMMRLTLVIALQTLFGTDPHRDPKLIEELSKAVTIVLERTNDLITNLLAPPLWVPLPSYIRFKRAMKLLDDFCYRMIDEKRKTPGDDLLSMLVSARDESTGQGMNDKQLRDEAVTILIAGHETTACVLSWTMWLLAKHPDIQDRLRAEVNQIQVEKLGPPKLGFECLQQLVYTRQVIDESMRLYPPAWMIGRFAVNDDVVGPYRIRKGHFALISPYCSHRHPTIWNDPLKFDPDRFSSDRASSIPKYAFIPFGGGPRFCIGANLATMESTLMLATLVKRFRVELIEGQPDPKPWAMITLRPRDGMMLKLTPI